jgi:tetratricopeptide (TPR) repeat protein
MPISSNEKNELISLCKSEYKENKEELKIINEFAQYYSSNQAISWYTRESFLYKMLTKAFKIQNINLLFLFRYIIHDIQCQLEENTDSLSKPVYRGQLMSKNELQMLKDSYKEFISINSFLSAIPDEKQVLLFLIDAQVSNDIERVLFKIQVDDDLNYAKTFNNIQSKSYHNQIEIFFPIGSIFQLIDIRLGENNIWIIKMILCKNNHSELKPIFKHIEEQYGNTKTSLLSFGLVLQKMNEFDEAEKYYQRLIKLLPSNHKDMIKCQNAIKTIPINKKNYETGLKLMNKSIEIHMETLETNDYHLALNHSNNGEMHRKNRDLDRALESYKKALIIWKKLFNDDHQEIGRCYNKMGLIYQEKDEYELAIEYYQKAKIILEKYLSTNHPDLSTIYGNIGDMHQHLIEYDQALENYIKSLEIAEKIFTSQHSLVILLMNKIANIYEEKKDFQQALFYYKKIASLLPDTHADCIKNKQNIERVSC